MWFTHLVKGITKSPLKVMKSLAKYGGRAILRRTGVFGIYGAVKKYKKLYKQKKWTKGQLAFKIAKSTVKKNILRALGPANYIRDFLKRGAKYTLKEFAWNKLVPMQIKKIIYINQNFKNIFGNEDILRESKKTIWKRLGRENKYNTDLWKLNQIEAIMKTPENDKERKAVKYMLNQNFYFRLNSPQTGNFSVRLCSWNPSTKLFKGYIRSGSKDWINPKRRKMKAKNIGGPYSAYLDIADIREMIKAPDYGKYFNTHFR